MFILYRYMLRQFVQIFIICFLSLTGLYVVIDAFGHLDHFSSFAEGEGRSVWAIVARYYAYQSLGFFDRTSSVLAMISAMFTVAWLARHQELTAIMAAGISKVRVARPLIGAALAISFLGVANRELVVPQVRDELNRDTRDLAGENARELEARFDTKSDVLIGGDRVVVGTRRILRPAFVLPPALSRYGQQLTAVEAQYADARPDRPAGFHLMGVTAPETLLGQPSLRLDDEAVVVTPSDAHWLAPDEVFVVSEIPFEVLATGSTWRNFASTKELVAELNRPSTDLGADVRVAVHARLVQPLFDGMLLMLGLPLMFSRSSRNVFLSIGICLVVATSFSLLGLACQALGGTGLLEPALAAWLPLLAFVPLAAAMYDTLKT
ncbi:MAG: LptF/LptG family permease [Pirellulales bacterium]|nr:LptF/LptG family permease [Pirellulales bacterium]